MWTGYNGCDFVPTDGGPAFNLDWSVGGNETSTTIYEQACADGVTVELEMAVEHVATSVAAAIPDRTICMRIGS